MVSDVGDVEGILVFKISVSSKARGLHSVAIIILAPSSICEGCVNNAASVMGDDRSANHVRQPGCLHCPVTYLPGQSVMYMGGCVSVM